MADEVTRIKNRRAAGSLLAPAALGSGAMGGMAQPITRISPAGTSTIIDKVRCASPSSGAMPPEKAYAPSRTNWKYTRHVFQTAGVPPKSGRTILPIIGSAVKSRTDARNVVEANRRTRPRFIRPSHPIGTCRNPGRRCRGRSDTIRGSGVKEGRRSACRRTSIDQDDSGIRLAILAPTDRQPAAVSRVPGALSLRPEIRRSNAPRATGDGGTASLVAEAVS